MITSTGNQTIEFKQVQNIVKSIRKHKGWTQKELAKRMGFTQEYISRIENKNNPSLLFQAKLAEVSGAEFEVPSFGITR